MDHAYAAAVANSGDPGEFADLLHSCALPILMAALVTHDPIQTCAARKTGGTAHGKNPAEQDAAAGLKREFRKTTYFVRLHQSSTSCFALSFA
jgi:hypothetical protein